MNIFKTLAANNSATLGAKLHHIYEHASIAAWCISHGKHIDNNVASYCNWAIPTAEEINNLNLSAIIGTDDFDTICELFIPVYFIKSWGYDKEAAQNHGCDCELWDYANPITHDTVSFEASSIDASDAEAIIGFGDKFGQLVDDLKKKLKDPSLVAELEEGVKAFSSAKSILQQPHAACTADATSNPTEKDKKKKDKSSDDKTAAEPKFNLTECLKALGWSMQSERTPGAAKYGDSTYFARIINDKNQYIDLIVDPEGEVYNTLPKAIVLNQDNRIVATIRLATEDITSWLSGKSFEHAVSQIVVYDLSASGRMDFSKKSPQTFMRNQKRLNAFFTTEAGKAILASEDPRFSKMSIKERKDKSGIEILDANGALIGTADNSKTEKGVVDCSVSQVMTTPDHTADNCSGQQAS